MYGQDAYVPKLLEFIKNSNKGVEIKALMYVSLRNDLYLEKLTFPERYEEIGKLQMLVHIDSQAYAHDISRGMNMWKLQKLSRYGYDGSTVTDPLFTPAELELKQDIIDAVQANDDAVNTEYEDQLNKEAADQRQREEEDAAFAAEAEAAEKDKAERRAKAALLVEKLKKLREHINKLNCK